MTSLVQNRNFRFIFSAHAISNLGDGVSALAFPWLASLITRDPALVAWVAFATHLPWFLFSIPAGVVTDRYDRKRLMVGADLFRMLLTCGVIALILNIGDFATVDTPVLFVAALSGLAFLLGSAEVARDNAAQTMLPSVVDKTQLERANGQLWSIEQIMGAFVGPPIAGLLIAWAVPAPFMLDAVTFGLAAWLVWAMTIPRRAAPPRRSAWLEAKEGWTWMRAHPVVLRLAVMLGCLNFFGLMMMTMLVLYSQDVLGLSAAGHGIMMACAAAGGVIGGIVCPWISARIGSNRSLFLALALFPVAPLLLALAGNPVLAAVALFLELFTAILWNVVTVSYRQRVIPDALLGRVNSIYRFFGWGMMPLGALVGGWISSGAEESLGREDALRLVFVVSTVGFVCIAVYGWRSLRLGQTPGAGQEEPRPPA